MQSKGDALVLCFVDFLSPAHAATAMDALQGELDVLISSVLSHVVLKFIIVCDQSYIFHDLVTKVVKRHTLLCSSDLRNNIVNRSNDY